jgi:hypothetical protein
VFRHEDAFTGGIPDISISFRGRTVWVEVKLDRPGRRSKMTELQSVVLSSLQGVQLIFEEHKNGTLGARMDHAVQWRGIPSRVKAVVYRDVAYQLLQGVGL